jgi:hypothetical protein
MGAIRLLAPCVRTRGSHDETVHTEVAMEPVDVTGPGLMGSGIAEDGRLLGNQGAR